MTKLEAMPLGSSNPPMYLLFSKREPYYVREPPRRLTIIEFGAMVPSAWLQGFIQPGCWALTTAIKTTNNTITLFMIDFEESTHSLKYNDHKQAHF
jgi:hypothetical protein